MGEIYKTVIYLKANRDVDYTYACVNIWIDVAKKVNARYFILCDNSAVKENLTSKFGVIDESVFLTSMNDRTAYISQKVANTRWQKASDAHLTTFFHARDNGFMQYWNIDADDTMFLLPTDRIADILNEVERVSEQKKIGLMSLDMWWTIHGGNNWTFGVTYTDTERADFFELMEMHLEDREYQEGHHDFNLDSYFNYLRNKHPGLIETFYVKNVDFIHWGGTYGPLHYKFRNGTVIFPKKILYVFANTLKAGTCDIVDEAIPVDVGANLSENVQLRSRRYLKSVSKEYGISPFVFGIKRSGFKTVLSNIVTSVKRRF